MEPETTWALTAQNQQRKKKPNLCKPRARASIANHRLCENIIHSRFYTDSVPTKKYTSLHNTNGCYSKFGGRWAFLVETKNDPLGPHFLLKCTIKPMPVFMSFFGYIISLYSKPWPWPHFFQNAMRILDPPALHPVVASFGQGENTDPPNCQSKATNVVGKPHPKQDLM